MWTDWRHYEKAILLIYGAVALFLTVLLIPPLNTSTNVRLTSYLFTLVGMPLLSAYYVYRSFKKEEAHRKLALHILIGYGAFILLFLIGVLLIMLKVI